MASTKTVGGLVPKSPDDPMNSLKRESLDRMRAAMLSASLDEPTSAAVAIRQVTILRVYHQVTRIIQYLDLMDKLEERLYRSVELELNSIDDFNENNFQTLTKLLAVQEKLQRSIIESNKILAPYLEVEQFPAFAQVVDETPISANVLEIPAEKRNALRENAGAILSELKALQEPEYIEG